MLSKRNLLIGIITILVFSPIFYFGRIYFKAESYTAALIERVSGTGEEFCIIASIGDDSLPQIESLVHNIAVHNAFLRAGYEPVVNGHVYANIRYIDIAAVDYYCPVGFSAEKLP